MWSPFPIYSEVVMNTSKSRTEHVDAEQVVEQAGRDAQGRFTAGNKGGPGNPFARRGAELRKVLMETVTDEELRNVAGQLMVKAKFGDLAAIKLLFQYVLGKPAATVNPDTLDVEEFELFEQSPLHAAFTEIGRTRLPADMAVDLLRVMLPAIGQATKEMISDAIKHPEKYEEKPDPLYDFGYDDEDEDEEEVPAEEELQPVGAAPEPSRAAPSPNGGTRGNGRPQASRPSTNGQRASAKRQAGPCENGDNGRRSPHDRARDEQPPRGA